MANWQLQFLDAARQIPDSVPCSKCLPCLMLVMSLHFIALASMGSLRLILLTWSVILLPRHAAVRSHYWMCGILQATCRRLLWHTWAGLYDAGLLVPEPSAAILDHYLSDMVVWANHLSITEGYRNVRRKQSVISRGAAPQRRQSIDASALTHTKAISSGRRRSIDFSTLHAEKTSKEDDSVWGKVQIAAH